MLNRTTNGLPVSWAPPHSSASATRSVDLDEVLSAARRQLGAILLGIVAVLLVATAYVAMAPKGYTATSDVLLDPRSFAAGGMGSDQNVLLFNSTSVDSQVEVFKSLKVIGAVIDKLDLTHDPEFTAPSLVSQALARILATSRDGAPPDSPEQLKAGVFAALEKRLVVSRVNKSFVIEVEFTSGDPAKAARIANAIADAFVDDQVESRTGFARRASGWLEERLGELRQRAMETDLAVQKFREDNNLVLAGGRLVNDQQLSELNSQLSAARVERSRAEAKFTRLNEIIARREIDGAVAESLSSPIIVELRTKALTATKLANDLAERVGPNHSQVQGLRREARNYED